MKRTRKYSVASLLLALVLVIGLTACGKDAEPVPDEGDFGDVTLTHVAFYNPLAEPEGSALRDDLPNLIPKIHEMKEENEHSTAWLLVPGTDIDDVVVKNPDDTNNSNAYYLRRDFYGRSNQDGTYYIGYSSNIDGTRGGLSQNTVMYGHSMNDNLPGRLLNPLKYLRTDEEIARETPYIYFSLEEEELIWEIFAVVDTSIYLPYNRASYEDKEFENLMKILSEYSYYDYGVEVTPEDRILTISTCTYNYDSFYPNDYRYAVFARLVGEDERLKEEAEISVNEDRKQPSRSETFDLAA